MTDPCNSPTACQARIGGVPGNRFFVYNCPALNFPGPLYFGLESYNLRVIQEDDIYDYGLYINSGTTKIAEFRAFPFNMRLTRNLDPSNFNMITINNILIVSTRNSSTKTRGITWRITPGTVFLSCLILDPNCTTTLPIEQAQVYTFPCALLPQAVRYGLVNYTVFLTYNPATRVYNARIDLLDGTSEIISFTINNGLFTIIGEPSTNSDFQTGVFNGNLRITYKQVTWSFLATATELGITVIVAPDNLADNPVPVPQPENVPVGCPTLFGAVEGTPDGKQICSSRFVVTFLGTSCPCCPDQQLPSFTSQRKEYVFYGTNLLPVLRGEGCNLVQRAESLTRPDRIVTSEGLATYGMLRLMLSLLLFGDFNLQFLRQSFYGRFLKKLKRSNFCAYYSLFRESEYWSYFCA